jgi:FkbM family methyltransferase
MLRAILPWTPKTILDVGGYKGHWTREVRAQFPGASVVVIEPNEHIELRQLGVPVHREVLASTVREVPWYSNLTTGDSMFKELTHHYNGIVPVTRKTTTLDQLFPTQRFEFVKLDCQGAELDILKGGEVLLLDTQAILLECAFAGRYNEGAPTFAEYIAYLDSIGFAPLDITEVHRANGVLCQVDIVFLRKTSQYWNTIQQKLTK